MIFGSLRWLIIFSNMYNDHRLKLKIKTIDNFKLENVKIIFFILETQNVIFRQALAIAIYLYWQSKKKFLGFEIRTLSMYILYIYTQRIRSSKNIVKFLLFLLQTCAPDTYVSPCQSYLLVF